MNLDEMQMKKRNEIIKWTGFALSAISPVILACIFIFPVSSDIGMALIHVLWCGLYGSILLWWSRDSRVLKWIMPVLNLPAFAFVALGAMMGGIRGLLIVILKMVIPYIPWITLLG